MRNKARVMIDMLAEHYPEGLPTRSVYMADETAPVRYRIVARLASWPRLQAMVKQTLNGENLDVELLEAERLEAERLEAEAKKKPAVKAK